MINTLKWKSFTLVVNDDHNDDDVQNIAKQLTISAIAENLCVIVHDDDSEGIKIYTCTQTALFVFFSVSTMKYHRNIFCILMILFNKRILN